MDSNKKIMEITPMGRRKVERPRHTSRWMGGVLDDIRKLKITNW
jgi:hypothetical protein